MKTNTMSGLVALFALLSVALANAGDEKGGKGGKGFPPDFSDFFRLDCRYHNVEHNPGANFCYASSVYQADGSSFRNVQLAVGCDGVTFFNDGGRIQFESTLDRISPFLAATPGVEVFPHGQLDIEGTYTSELDIHLGRFSGLCYVHRIDGHIKR